MSWWVLDLYAVDPFRLICYLFWVPFSVVLHELGHGVAALWEGDDTPRRLGRITLNPLVHMGGFALLVFALIGITWGVMPVNPNAFRHRRYGDVIVAAAGPLVNLALALVTLTLLAPLVHFGQGWSFSQNLQTFLLVGGSINVLLMFFNLLPVPPLDGASILGGLSRSAREFLSSPEVRQYGFFVLLAAFWFGGGEYFFAFKDLVVWKYLGLWGVVGG